MAEFAALAHTVQAPLPGIAPDLERPRPAPAAPDEAAPAVAGWAEAPFPEAAVRLVHWYFSEARRAALSLLEPAGLCPSAGAPLPGVEGFVAVPAAEPALRIVRQFAAMAPAALDSCVGIPLPASFGVQPKFDEAPDTGAAALAPDFGRIAVRPPSAETLSNDPSPLRFKLSPASPALARFAAATALPEASFSPTVGAAVDAPGMCLQAAAAPVECGSRSTAPSVPPIPHTAVPIGLPHGDYAPTVTFAADVPSLHLRLDVAPAGCAPEMRAPGIPNLEAVPARQWRGEAVLAGYSSPIQLSATSPVPGTQPVEATFRPEYGAPAAMPALGAEGFLPEGFVRLSGPAAESCAATVQPGLQPITGVPAATPSVPGMCLSPAPDAAAEPELTSCAVAGFFPLDYYSQRCRGCALYELAWIAPECRPVLPGFALAPLPDRLTEEARKPGRKGPAAVVAMPSPSERSTVSARRWRGAAAVAAGLFVGLALWGGIRVFRVPPQSIPASRFAALADSSAEPASPDVPLASAASAAAPRPRPAKSGPVAWVGAAAARRASVQVTDTFQTGMEAWGAAPRKWAAGWTRHPDGYVRPGQLALLRPTLRFQDYRLEFFGQIENKSLAWVVRARDQRNYHAMKLTVVEPGLRPVISIAHYSVVNGKSGRKIEIPLNVMVHNAEPYRVAVAVKGSRVVTSIGDQEVDAWGDGLLASGGVGFFSDAGEKARLYWMKVSANDDMLGRVCALVADALGQGTPATAGLWPPKPHGGVPGAGSPLGFAPVAALAGFGKRRTRSWEC